MEAKLNGLLYIQSKTSPSLFYAYGKTWWLNIMSRNRTVCTEKVDEAQHKTVLKKKNLQLVEKT